MTPLGREGNEEEVKNLIVYLSLKQCVFREWDKHRYQWRHSLLIRWPEAYAK